MELMYVICFYWEGDRWSSHVDQATTTDGPYQRLLQKTGDVSLALASSYVNNLYRGVERFASRPFEFICFTNEPLVLDKAIEKRSFQLPTTHGVLPRVYMFSREANLENRQVLCLDLDIVIVRSLKPLMDYDGLFCARSKFALGEEHKLDGDVMSFRAGDEVENLFWKPFIADIPGNVAMTMGRERYWVRHVANDFADRWDKVAPGAVISYKWSISMRNRPEPPSNAVIVSCHGIPRPHQIKSDWIKPFWSYA